ncbi:hypothetical protein [Thermus caldilimi]|uniref:hypothetical protein n=1 Tax=Thermus caldilimi TaxID=2483360 RepID=UPI00107631EA|nr:hypothetical protein [Thermus caldilimi]
MAGRILALDEWLFHDLWGENGPERLGETLHLLEAILAQCDRILFPPGSPWAEKAFALAKRGDPPIRVAARLLFGGFLWNAEKTTVPDHEGNLGTQGSSIPQEDRYLVKAALASRAEVLVTTDQGLLQALRATNLLPVKERGEFLQEYLGKGVS